MKKNISHRIISALIAVTILFTVVYYGERLGIYILALLAAVRGAFEIARMFFDENYPKFIKRFFVILVTLIFLIITREQFKFIANFALIFSFVFVTSFGILFHKHFKNLDQILTFVAKCCLGLVYTCFLPATVVWTSQTSYGMAWFFCMLSVVFAGDIGAFIFGMAFGKTKIAPTLSPNKSLQGSIGGLVFSVITALGFSYFIPNTPLYILLICGLLGGTLGQIGDFFESLIKRVSGVKDSGSIMPGHGGVLDRLDGVYLSAPLFYFMASYFSF